MAQIHTRSKRLFIPGTGLLRNEREKEKRKKEREKGMLLGFYCLFLVTLEVEKSAPPPPPPAKKKKGRKKAGPSVDTCAELTPITDTRANWLPHIYPRCYNEIKLAVFFLKRYKKSAIPTFPIPNPTSPPHYYYYFFLSQTLGSFLFNGESNIRLYTEPHLMRPSTSLSFPAAQSPI